MTSHASLVRKLCNCLVPEAEADLSRFSAAAKFIGVDAAAEQAEQAAVEVVMRGFRAFYGGLWVGGSAELTAQALTFRPNALNQAIHTGDYSLSVPLRDITAVEHTWGFVSGIVTVTTTRGKFKLRCFGARQFRKDIDRARTAVEQLPG